MEIEARDVVLPIQDVEEILGPVDDLAGAVGKQRVVVAPEAASGCRSRHRCRSPESDQMMLEISSTLVA